MKNSHNMKIFEFGDRKNELEKSKENMNWSRFTLKLKAKRNRQKKNEIDSLSGWKIVGWEKKTKVESKCVVFSAVKAIKALFEWMFSSLNKLI